MKKNLLLKRLFSVLFLLFISTISWAYDFEVDGIYYSKNSDGTSVIVTYKTTRFNSYSGDVVIPSSVKYNEQNYDVTSIGEYAFRGCSGITSVVIPNSVTTIGEYAFRGCSSLTSITIPNSVTSIGEYAFWGCSGLTSVVIPNSVTTIGEYAFRGCSGLTTINIPESVTSIGKQAFYNCSGLPVIDNIRYADTYLVSVVDKTKSTYNIKEGTRLIGDGAFFNCSFLTSITIPASVTSIGENAFVECYSLTKAEFASIESLCNINFNGNPSCNPLTYAHHLYIDGQEVKDVVIPNSVTSIGNYAFYGCSDLTKAEFASIESLCNMSFYSSDSNPLYYAKYLYVNGEKIKNLVIPNSVTSIGNYAFSGCSGLTSVTIPESVTSIGNAAFVRCSGLTSITIPNSVTSIGWSAFNGCSGLTSVTIPESVTSIGWGAFLDCSGLTSITIPNSVTSIGGSAFRGCSGLTSVIIGSRVKSIGESAFYGCSGLTSVTCLAENVPNTGYYAFEDVPQSTATLYVPETSLNAYKTTYPWDLFGNIVGIDPTAVEELKSKKTVKANENAPIFDLMGRRLQQKPASGYYIQGGKKYFVK